MSQDIHVFLNECKAKTESLVIEIENYKKSVKENQDAAESLESVAEAIKEIVKQVIPLTEGKFRKFQITLLVWSAINSVFMISIILLLWLRN